MPHNIRNPQKRLEDLVMGLGALSGSRFPAADMQRVTVEPWMVAELVKAETAVRGFRHQLEAQLSDEPRRCDRCGEPIGGRSDRRFCSDRCRIEAHLLSKRPATTDRAV